MKCRTIVVGLIRDGNRILLGQKPAGKGPYPDTWHLPGGGINFGEENCEEALLREIKEETGLDAKIVQKVVWDTDVEPDKHGEETYYIFLPFICEFVGGKLVPGDDMRHFEWVDIARLSNYNLTRPSKILFKKLGYL